MKVVIILPTYNERENIKLLLNKLLETRANIPKHEISILVVDDNSPDGTGAEVEKFKKKSRDIHISSGKKQGLGKALLRGMKHAKEKLNADIILQMDADLSHDPQVIPKFIKLIDQGADFVVGSRYIPGGSIPDNWGIHRKIFSVLGNSFVRFGLGFPEVHDWTGGFRAYEVKYFQKNRESMKKFGGYVFQIAFLHKAVSQGANVKEVPICFTDRAFGHSKIAPSKYIRDVFSYVLKNLARKVMGGVIGKMIVVGFIGFIINTIILEALVYFGFHPTIGSIVGAETAIVSNFVLNNAWTFQARKITGISVIGKFIQFNLTSIGAVVIQAGTVFAGTYLFSVETYRIWYMLGVGLGLIWNFSMYAFVIWKKR